MLPTTERGFLYKLRRDECVSLLAKLGLDSEGAVAVLRVKLIGVAKKATPDQIENFLEAKKEFLNARENTYIKTWVNSISEAECADILQGLEIEPSIYEEDNRTVLEQHINNFEPTEKENWVEYAKDFCKELEEGNQEGDKTSTGRQKEREEDGEEVYEEPANNRLREDRSIRENFRGRERPAEIAVLMDQARKWGISYDGLGKPQEALKFLDRVLARADSFQLPKEKIPLVLPVLLKGLAESWYDCHKEEWVDWASCEKSFKLFFLPAKFREEMDEEVKACIQKEEQPIKDFILKLRTMMRFVPSLTPSEQLDRVYKNLTVGYQLNIKRSEFRTLEELILLGEEYEEKVQKASKLERVPANFNHQRYGNQRFQNQLSGRNHYQKNFSMQAKQRHEETNLNSRGEARKTNPFRDSPGTPRLEHPVSEEQERKTNNSNKWVCYNCDRTGHTARYCKQPYRPYCKKCSKKGVSTKECGCENEPRPLNLCATCRESGHTSQECPKKRIWENGNQSANSVTTVDLGNLGTHIDRRPRRKIEIAEKGFIAILDTGATTSYINSEVRKHLVGKKIEGTTAKVITRLANGLDTDTNTIYKVEIKLGQKIIKQNVLTLGGMNEEVILGIDALEKFGFTLTEQPEVCATADWYEIVGNEIVVPIQRHEMVKDVFQPFQRCANLTTKSPLSVEQEEILKKTLAHEFEKFDNLNPCTDLVEHTIKMKTSTPIKLRYFPKNPKMREVIYAQVDELLQNNLIEPSASAYCSPIVLVKKKDASWRMCIDYRKINENSERDAYPIPHIPNTLSRLQKARVVSALDLKNGYWQIPISPESRQFTAFVVPGRGLFQWRVMPFGLHSAPATFQRFLDLLITQNFEDFAVAYLDDIIIFSENFDDHMKHLRIVLSKLATANLKINKEKSVFCQTTLKYLGHIVGSGGIQTDPEKVKAIEELPPPTCISGVRRIIGMAGWYGAFIPNFTNVIAPLNELLTKNAKFSWGERQQKAFEEIKSKMKSAPILACPNYERPFFLQTDASNVGLGAVLFQREGDKEHVIAYRSRALSSNEKNYTTTEKECLAVIWAIQRNIEYLEGIPFTVITDHLALKWIFKLPNPTGRLGRWVLELRNHDFVIEYRKGKQNVVPDTLSRHPLPINEHDEEICATTSSKIISCEWLDNMLKSVAENPEKFPNYAIENGKLVKNCGTGELNESNWKLCVAKPLRQRVLEENHSVVTAGHLGIKKTINRIQRKYYWPRLKPDVIRFINQCEECLAHKIPQKKPAGLMFSTKSQGPWDIVTIDFIGPLPRSTQGHQHVLVIQDKFSKWVECIPVRTATAAALKKALRDRILCHFGWPRLVITDNGSQFISNLFKMFLKRNGIKHQLTPRYSPQCNSTERVNRVVKTMIKMDIRGDQRKWDEHLSEIQFAVNTAVQDSTGFSPAELNFGRELRTMNSLYDEELPFQQEGEIAAPEVKERMKSLCSLAKRKLEVASQQQARYYNLRRRSWNPRVGDLVYRRNFYQSNAGNAFNAKLAPAFSGPYVVMNYVSPTIVEICKPESPKKLKRSHLKDLKEMAQPNIN